MSLTIPLDREVILMKVVVVKSPKVISGLLRMIFGINKED
ncbi:stage V sporulation protein SpoVM [uncultured Ruminococcus sp.]